MKINPSAMLIGAAQRVDMPILPARISYDETTDTLYLKFRDDLEPNRTDDDLENGLVFDYYNRILVGVEVLGASNIVSREEAGELIS
ncbi:MAG: DUF2283 domain-containing protein [Acidobacteriota bacterium]|nr:DUF2283 domain-containing protein [Acidobacteriota bacterium]